MPSPWVVLLDTEDHVIPLEDRIVHTVSPDCICGPDVEPFVRRGQLCRHVDHRDWVDLSSP